MSRSLAALEASGVRVRRGVSGAALTTFAVGGPVSLIEPKSLEEVERTYRLLREEGLPFLVLGYGSNSIIPDSGLPQPMIRLGGSFKEVVAAGEDCVEVGAAVPLMRLSRTMSVQGLGGLEFASGIPASVGGAIVMNAGAHGSDMSAVVRSVELLNTSGTVETFQADELSFVYRSSQLPSGSIVLGSKLRLSARPREEAQKERVALLEFRKRTQPLSFPCAGSVFKNPPSDSAGRLLELAGLKGARVGGAKVSALHANWIVNEARSATADDVERLIAKCQDEVWKVASVELEPEIRIHRPCRENSW